ncbi:MAG: hypothetical protein WDM77_16120 [Steroidobacteraceae bacterium]
MRAMGEFERTVCERRLPASRAAADGAVGNQSDAFLAAEGDHLPFLLAVQQAVVVLHADKARQVQLVGAVEHLRQLVGRHGRGADIAYFAGLDDIGQRFECFVDRGYRDQSDGSGTGRRSPDPSLQAAVDGFEDVFAREAALVGSWAHGLEDLGGDHRIVAFDSESRQRLAEDEFAFSIGVHISRIEEIDAQFQRAPHDGEARRFRQHPVGAAAETHAAEADA